MKTITREELLHIDTYAEILRKESHHNHEIIEDEHGVYRWKADPVIELFFEHSDFNAVIVGLLEQGYTKNSEEYRKLYRDLGYSLFGYWEVFYWDLNNEDAAEYRKDIE